MKKILFFSILCLASQFVFSQIAKIDTIHANKCATAGGAFSTITLIDNSTGSQLSREWKISNSPQSYTNKQFDYNFTSPGTYKVVLTVTYVGGTERKDSITVIIHPVPVFSIAKGNNSICPGENIPFSYTLSPQTTSTITDFLWNFGDNSFSTSTNPVHRYDNNQNEETYYNISLTLTDNNGCIAKVDSNNFVHVRSKPEVAFATDNSSFCFAVPPIEAVPVFINYTDTATKRLFAQNAYTWKFGDGNTATQYYPAITTTHTYKGAGIYFPKLIAVDQFGCSDSVVVTPIESIRLTQLNANYTVSDTLVCALPDTIIFEGLDWGLNYRWRIATLNHHNDQLGKMVNIPLRKSDTGTHKVYVTVVDATDKNCSITDTITIRVYDKVLSTILVTDSNECDPTHVIDFTNATVYPWADDYGHAVTNWYFGDMTSQLNSHQVSHIYGTNAVPDNPLHGKGSGYGNYRVLMTGTTPYGCPMDTAYQWIHIYRMHAVGKVTDPAPPDPPHGCAPHTVTLVNIMDSLVSSSDINTIIWRWDYDGQWDPNDTFPTHAPFVLDADGNQEQDHTYNDTGIYNVYFTLINEQECVHDVKITTIKVGYPPLTDFTFIPDTACKADIQIIALAYDSLDASGNLVAKAWANGWAWNDDNGSPIGTPNDTSTILPNEVGGAAVTLVSSHNGCSAEYQPRKEGMGLVCPPISVIDKPKNDDPDPGPPVYCNFSEIPNPFEHKSKDQGAIYLRWYKGDSDRLLDTANQSRSPLMVYDALTDAYSWDSTGWIKDTIVQVNKKGQTISEKRGVYQPGIIINAGTDGNYGFRYDTGSYLKANNGLVEITLWAMNDSSVTSQEFIIDGTDTTYNSPWFNKCGYCEHTTTQKMYISHAKMNFTVSQPSICQRDSIIFFDSTDCNVGIFGWGFKFDWADQPARSDFAIGNMVSIKNYTPWPDAGNGKTVNIKNTNSYKVVLIDTCGFGCIRTDTLKFDVHPRSIPAFVSGTDSILFDDKKDIICINDGGYFYLQDKSYSLPPFTDTEITNWEWRVGSFSDTAQNPTLQFSYAGWYDLTLKITNEYGCSSDTVFYDQVLVDEIYAQFVNPSSSRVSGSICNKTPTVFRNNSKVLGFNNQNTYLKYEWDWGDGDTSMYYALANVTANGVHSYDLPDLVNKVLVRLRVTVVDPITHQPKGCSAEYIDTVIIERPIANFTTAQSVFACSQDELEIVGRTITFNDSSQGNISILTWNFGDTASGSANRTMGSPTENRYKNPSHTYLNVGHYDVLLIAQDVNNCMDTMLSNVFIDIAAPQGSVSYTPTEGCVPFTVTFNFAVSSDSHYMPDSIVINTGSAHDSILVGNSPLFNSLSTVYTDQGTYIPYYTLYKTVVVNGIEEVCKVRLWGNDTIYTEINFNYSATICQGGIYNDDNFANLTQAGTYYNTLQSINGCDSTVCLSLSWSITDTIHYFATICKNETYNDNNFVNLIQAGTYYNTLQSINGCDSIVSLSLNWFIDDSTYYSATICQNEIYNDNNFTNLTQAGIYYNTLQSINGCDSTVCLDLSWSIADTIHYSAIFSQGGAYSDNNFTNLTQEGIYCITLQTINGCDSIVCLNLRYAGAATGGCLNLNFSMGNFTNWQGYLGSCGSGININPSAITFGRHTIMDGAQLIRAGQLYDEQCMKIKKVPDGFAYAAKIGNDSTGAEMEAIEYTMTVGSDNSLLLLHFAWIMEYVGDHSTEEQPRFILTIRDSAGYPIPNSVLPCAFVDFTASTDMDNLACYGSVIARDWTTVGYSLEHLIGRTIKIYFETRDCTLSGHYGYAYVVAECRKMTLDLMYCEGQNAARFKAPDGFKNYTWTRSSNPSWRYSGAGRQYQNLVIQDSFNDEIITCEVESALAPECSATLNTVIRKTSIDATFGYGVKENGGVDFASRNNKNWYDTCSRTATFVDRSNVINSEQASRTWYIHGLNMPIPRDSMVTVTFPDPGLQGLDSVRYLVRLMVGAENGCIDTSKSLSSHYITIYASSRVEIARETELCQIDTIILKANAIWSSFVDYTWIWYDSNSAMHTSTGNSINIISPDTYYLEATDINGCIARDTLIVTQLNSSIDIQEIHTPSCFGGNDGWFSYSPITIGKAPYQSFVWSVSDTTMWQFLDSRWRYDSTNNAYIDPIASVAGGTYLNLPVGTYTFEVVDFVGCAFKGEIIVPEAAPLELYASQKPESGNMGNGTIILTAIGGTPPYTYNVEQNGQYATIIKINNDSVKAVGLSAGIYNISVTDVGGNMYGTTCTTSDTIVVGEVPCQIDLQSNDLIMGAVAFIQYTPSSDTIIFEAIPNAGYRFVQWNDGDTNNPRTIVLSQDTTFIAEFATEINSYNITVSSNDNSMGIVSGSGIYQENEIVILAAIALSGYKFVQWNDGIADNPRIITVTQDTAFIAEFTINDVDTIKATISGAITLEKSPTTAFGKVYLYLADPNAMRYLLVDSVNIQSNGTYTFVPVAEGNYLLKAIASNISNTIPTYYGNTDNWSLATTISVTDTVSLLDKDIEIIVLNPLTGNSRISGYVGEDNDGTKSIHKSGVENPCEGVTVLLKIKETLKTIARTQTDNDGYFEFKNIPVGNYIVVLDIPGLGMIDYHEVEITEDGQTVDDVNYTVTEDGIETEGSSNSIKQLPSDATLNIYPNPVYHSFYIQSSLVVEQVSIYDISGRMLKQICNPRQEIQVGDLANGIYLVKVKTVVGEMMRKIVKQ